MLYRDQKRIDQIGYLIQQHNLLPDADIHTLAFDLGDIEDATAEWSKLTDVLLKTLQEYEKSPKDCSLAFGAFMGMFQEFREHMESAAKVIEKAQKKIHEQHPDIYPDDDE